MSTCIYCGESKPFTDEHVVSAGLGGDDKKWMLKDCVCKDCNTIVFSKLEASFLRASPVAIARLFHQEKTRGRGGKTGTPRLNTKQSFLEDRERNIFLNQELRQGFEPIVLPQIVLETLTTFSAHLPDAEVGREFFGLLRNATADSPVLVQKVKTGFEVGYRTVGLTWDKKKEEFLASAPEIAAKPPKQAGEVIWVEELVMPLTSKSASKLTPRVYRRSQGQLVCAVLRADDAPRFLTHLRRSADVFTISDDTVPIETPANDVHLALQIRVDVHDRVMTKIGINLAAKLFGLDFVRRPEFARAKDYARTGRGHILKINADKHPSNQLMTAGYMPDIHIFCIAEAKSDDDSTRLLTLMARLYGGPIESFALAELPKDAPELSEPIVVMVAYNENVIDRYSFNDLRKLAESDGLGATD